VAGALEELAEMGEMSPASPTRQAGGKWDTFRMLTHPGTIIIPGALVAAEATGASGREAARDYLALIVDLLP
jgi:hypothetical protein